MMENEHPFDKIFRLFGSTHILSYSPQTTGYIDISTKRSSARKKWNKLNLLVLSKSIRRLLFATIMKNIEVPFGSAVLSKYDDYNQFEKLHIDFNYPIDIDVLPENLKELRFGDSWKRYEELTTLPSSLTKLTFGKKNYKPMNDFIFPENLKYLAFGERYNQPLYDALDNSFLPDSLISLTFGTKFNAN